MTELPGEASIIHDTSWQFIAEASRLVAGVGVFVLIARSLGPSEFGLFVAISSVVTFIVPFANLGAPLLLVQRIRRDGRPMEESFGAAIGMTIAVGLGAAAILLPILVAVLHRAPPSAVIGVAVGEFVFGGIMSACAYSAIAAGNLRASAAVTLLDCVGRLSAAVWLTVWSTPSVTSWALAQCAADAITAAVALIFTVRSRGIRLKLTRPTRRDAIDGLPYCASIAAFSVQDGIDKPLMVRFGWNVDAGWYGAAYRIPALAFVPVQALVVATFNRSFSVGRSGMAATIALARRLLLPSLLYSIVAAGLIVVLAPAARPFLGHDFDGALPMLKWLAILPILRTLQYFPANAMTGAGYPRYRLMILLGVLSVNIVLCLALIPGHSWRGAATATLITEALYALLLWLAALRLIKHEAVHGPLLSGA